MSRSAAVIVPSVSNPEGLRVLLESLAGGDHELVIIDNGSRGGEVSSVAAREGVRVIRFERNAGFGRAVNAAAATTTADALVVVNDDARFEPGFVEAITAGLDPGGGVVMAAGVLRSASDPSRIDSAGIVVDRTLLASDYLNGEPVGAAAGAPDPFGPCAAAAAYDRIAFETAGGFDEGLFAYLEDVDLALRLRLAGGRCALVPAAAGLHDHSATLGAGSAEKDYLTGFGRGYLLRKWGIPTGAGWPAVAARELPLTVATMLVDRTFAPLRGRRAGWRAADPDPSGYPGGAIEGTDSPSAGRALLSRLARRRQALRPVEAGLETAIPEPLDIGSGTAVALEGWIRGGEAAAALVAGPDRAELVTRGRGGAGRWSAILPFSPADGADEQRELALEAGSESLALGSVTIRRAPPDEPGRPASSARIAICMATWEPDRSRFERQLESIRRQSCDDWICVISDDASSPEALAAVEEAIGGDPRFVLSSSPERRGFYRNFERALRLAPEGSEYIALCDQDDRWDDDKLEVLAALLDRTPAAELAYSDMRMVAEDLTPISDTYWVERRNNPSDLASVLFANNVTGAASMFRRRLLADALPFPVTPGTPYHDHWLALCALAGGELAYLDRPTHDRTRHGESITVGARAAARPDARSLYFDRYLQLAVFATVLELRLGERIVPAKLRVLRRVVSADRALGPLGWLALRSVRPWFGRDETLARERLVLAGLVWRRTVGRGQAGSGQPS